MARFNSNTFRSENQSWETPQEFFDLLNSEFKFDIDLAASSENKKCHKFISSNSLEKVWSGIGWLNPPFGGSGNNSLKHWIKKAFNESRKEDTIVVMLIPARTNTMWWHDYCMKASEIRLIRGRIKFKGNKHGLPFPLAIIVFSSERTTPLLKTQEMMVNGKVWQTSTK